MPDLSVKGIWFADYAKMVCKLKDLTWERYLTPEDLKIIRGRILPAQWYPLELYQRVAIAAFKLVGQGKPEMAQLAGRAFMDQLAADEALRPFLNSGDPERALQHFTAIHKRLITLGDARYEKIAARHIRYTVTWTKRWEGLFPFVHNFAGFLVRLVEVNGGKQVKISFDDQNLENKDSVDFIIKWD